MPRDTGSYCTPAIRKHAFWIFAVLSFPGKTWRYQGLRTKEVARYFLCLVVREVSPGLEIRERAHSCLLPLFQHPICLLCSIQPASCPASNTKPSVQAGTKWQMAHIFLSILWYPTCTSRETRRPWTMVLASLIQPSQPSRDPDSQSATKNLNPKACCAKTPFLSVFFTGLSSIVLMMFRGNSLLRRLFFFFNLTNGFFHYSQHFNDR